MSNVRSDFRFGSPEKHEGCRGEPLGTIKHMLRAQRIRLREVATEAVRRIEAGYLPTREYVEYMLSNDVEMGRLLSEMAKLRKHVSELEAMQADAEMQLLGPPEPDHEARADTCCWWIAKGAAAAGSDESSVE